MSRFLARALALARAKVAPIARPSLAPKPSEAGLGDFGDFGERVEHENALPASEPLPAFDWPKGVDYWLTHDARQLAGVLNMGGSYRWCPNGGLDVWQGDGRYVGFGPDKIVALRSAGLLPDDVRTNALECLPL